MVTDDNESYTGDVSPGGEPDVRTLGCLTVTKVAVDPEMSNNCYLLHCSETDELVLIDAAAEPERLLELIGDRSLTTIVTTHQHWDHHRGLAAVKAAHPGAVVVAGEPDADAIAEQTGVAVERRVGEGDTVAVGTCDLQVIPIAGHTPGSIVLLLDDTTVSPTPHLFTGDSLFPGGVGSDLRRRRPLRPADRRGGDQDLRPAPRRDVVLPRPRRRRRARQRAAAPRGVARARLVSLPVIRCSASTRVDTAWCWSRLGPALLSTLPTRWSLLSRCCRNRIEAGS